MNPLVPSPDPYDIWSSAPGIRIKEKYYQEKLSGKVGAYIFSIGDWFFPSLARTIFSTPERIYPISYSLGILALAMENGKLSSPAKHLRTLESLAIRSKEGNSCSWGLGFYWISKNGLYPPDLPFVTHTPYAMEALLLLAEIPSLSGKAHSLFSGTWHFLKSLRVMEKSRDNLALSYAPVDEPRIVVNANSYAAFAHALHAIHGEQHIQEEARDRTKSLCRWVVQQQAEDGSWRYYADDQPGNFIDCFHSCFVVKNLLKTEKLLPELSSIVRPAIEKGWNYIRSTFPDPRSELCRRFSQRAQRDPFRWDLYDQAEYLGLLVDFGQLEEASEFARLVETRFRKGEHWYCRIDLLGRRWGRNFLRWGIVPFWYHQSRLQRALKTGTA